MKGTREAVRLGRNFASITAAQFIVQVLTFALSVTLARTFGEGPYGVFVFGFAFPSLFLLLLSAGLDDVIAVDVAAQPSHARLYLTTVGAVRLPLAAVVLAGLWISTEILLADPLSRAVVLVLGASAVLQTYAGTFLSVFRAFERLEYAALVLLIERGFTIAVAFVLLVAGYGLLEIAMSFLAGGGIALALSAILVRRKFAWFSALPRRATVGGILRKAVPFALGGVTSTVILSTGPVLLGLLRDTVEVGLFNAGFALLMMVLSLLTLLHFVLLPTMARIHEVSPERLPSVLQHVQRFVFALGLPAALGAALYAESIVTVFFGPAFALARDPFTVLMGAVVIGAACIGNAAALAAAGRQTENLYVGCVGALTLVGLSVLLIPVYGPVGAALGFVLGSGVMGVLGTIVTRHYVVRVDLIDVLARPALAATAMALALFLLRPAAWLGIPLGALIYLGSLRATGGIQEGDWGMLRDAMRGALGREG